MFGANMAVLPCPRCGQRDAEIFGPDSQGQMRCGECNEEFGLVWLFDFIASWLPYAVGFQKAIETQGNSSVATRG